MRKMSRYLVLLRPFTLLAPLIVSLSVMAASYVYATAHALPLLSLLWSMIPACLSLALLNGASNALNQAADFREDSLSKPYRPLPQGLVTVREAYRASFLLYLVAVGFALLVSPLFAGFVVGIALFTVTYSLPPRMKRVFIINQLWVALPRGLLGILASWSVFASPFHQLPLTIGGIASVFLFGGTATKDVLDAGADRTVGTNTMCNVLGLRTTAVVSTGIMMASFAAVIPLVAVGVLPEAFVVLSLLMGCGLLIGVLLLRGSRSRSWENTSAWLAMYVTYFCFMVCFSALTIFSSLAIHIA